MSNLRKIIPLALLVLVLHRDLVTADDYEFEYDKEDFGLRFYDFYETRSDALKSNEAYSLTSYDYPSRLSFRYLNNDDEDGKKKTEAYLERYDQDKLRKCSFLPFDDYDGEFPKYNLRLRSLKNDIEIFEAIKFFKDPKYNYLDLYIINMTDCKYSRAKTLKGYDFKKYRGALLALNPRDERYFEIFSLNGKEECGSFMCRRTYYITNQTLSEPKSFELFDKDQFQDWRLIYLSALSGNFGYYSLIRQKMYIRLLSLSYNGSLINSIEEKIDEKLRFLRISTANDAFGACYTLESKPKEVQCLQFDRKLNINYNKTLTFDNEISYLSLYNLPQDGYILMTAQCLDKKSKGLCDNYSFNFTKYKFDGTYGELMLFKEESCAPRRRQPFKFYQDASGKLCIYYVCDCAEGKCDETLRYKCLGDFKEL